MLGQPRSRRWILGLSAVAVVAAILVIAMPSVALLLAPALVLATLLLMGFTPGAELLDRLRARRFAPRARRAPRALVVRRVVVLRRMARIAASALAMRPPPAALS